MFIMVHDSGLSVRNQVCLGAQISALTTSLDELKGLGDFRPLWRVIDWLRVWVICVSSSCMFGSEIGAQYVQSSL
jgi:hypothetical protein